MTTAIIVMTGGQPAAVHVSESSRIDAADHRGWANTSIDYFIDRGGRREFTLSDTARIEVHQLPPEAKGLDDLYTSTAIGAPPGPLAIGEKATDDL